LTIATKGQGWLEVALIPETLAKTALRLRLQGARVNIEADSMAKIIAAEVARQMQLLRIPGV
jgi:riboflavin synthase alpha subunit